MDVNKILKAIASGKRGHKIYDLLSHEDRLKLDEYAKFYGVNRKQRRKLKKDVRKKKIHTRTD